MGTIDSLSVREKGALRQEKSEGKGSVFCFVFFFVSLNSKFSICEFYFHFGGYFDKSSLLIFISILFVLLVLLF